MASIVLEGFEIKFYVASIGPGVGRPERPHVCPFCDCETVWFDGWRFVFCVVLAGDVVHRFADGLPLQRVVCASCRVSWTLRPAFLYPHRVFAIDVLEAAGLAYLSDEAATYVRVAAAFACSPRSLWRWVGWVATLARPAAIVAKAERIATTGETPMLIPRTVPQNHFKAYSLERDASLLRAFQTLTALGLLHRAQPVPSADPSPLRQYLYRRFRALGEVRFLVTPGLSPPLPVDQRTPHRIRPPP